MATYEDESDLDSDFSGNFALEFAGFQKVEHLAKISKHFKYLKFLHFWQKALFSFPIFLSLCLENILSSDTVILQLNKFFCSE
jgi:hypothetical protein